MTKKFKFGRLFWSESRHDMILDTDNSAMFNVNFGKLLVGTRYDSDVMGSFSYINDFKVQNRILPLTNFPQKDKEYSSRELWPFFTSRIPSNSQLQLDKEKPKEDIISLLRRFGRRTIANPYEIHPVM